jgi:hypothetical protein
MSHLSPEKLVERFGGTITKKTLRNWRTNGTGPRYIRLGKRIVYPLRDVEIWEEEQMVASCGRRSSKNQ